MWWHVYVLKSKVDGENYVGMTNDLAHRIKLHNSGKVFATQERYPFALIYVESYRNRNDAASREQFPKSGWGKNYIRRVLKNWYKKL